MKSTGSTNKWQAIAIWIAVWTVVGLIFSLFHYASMIGSPRQLGFSYALRMNMIHYYLWGLLWPIIFGFSKRFPVEFRPLRIGNLLLHIPAIVLFAITQLSAHAVLAWMLVPYYRKTCPTFAYFSRAFMSSGIYLALIFAWLFVVGSHAFLYYQRFKSAEEKRTALTAQLAQAELQALKMQLHPHFLFNTLHSISSLVLEDPPKANSMIARLGDFLRLTLEHSDEQMVKLEQELEFLRCYLEIEQVRFEDRLTVEFTVDPDTLSQSVPHMILQPLVENAIRHGIAPRAVMGHLEICSTRSNGVLHLEVNDNGPGLGMSGQSIENGLGLKNVRARLQQIYGKDYSFDLIERPEGGLRAVLNVPFNSESGQNLHDN
jgi:signal transduction histidine kinase